jgi:hypothetical protein
MPIRNKKVTKNGFSYRWEQMSLKPNLFCEDNRLLFHIRNQNEINMKDWDVLIDVPLLPLTTPFMPTVFSKTDYREMNPGGYESTQTNKKQNLEMTIQRLTQNFQIVSKTGSIALNLEVQHKINMS